MIVDDNADILEAYIEMLRRAGFEAVPVSDGASAIEQALRVRPDVVVVDLWMPGMDGFETARTLKADDRTKDAPIIAFTSLGYSDRKAEEAGCAAVVRKGDPEQLLAAILKVTATARGAADAQ
jgi:CheY-like chemotaxis protein